MGDDRRIVDSAEEEALVDATDHALQVKATLASTADLDTLEATLTELEKALQSVNADYLKVQHRDASDNLMPSMDTGARRGYIAIHDGTNELNPKSDADAYTSDHDGIIIMAKRQHGPEWRAIPMAQYTDSIAEKGTYVVPVTPMTSEREEGTRTHTNDACFVVAYEVTGVDAKTGYVLIDLSNATNYPHTLTNEIHVDWIAFSMLGDATAEGHVHIGFISKIGINNGDLEAFVCKPVDKGARTAFVSRQYSPSAVRCKDAAMLAGGGMHIADDTTFQTDVALQATYFTVAPAVGDLVMLVDRVAGTFDTVSVTVGYHTI